QVQSTIAKFLNDDDSPPVDKTPFRLIFRAPPESKALFGTPQSFPIEAAPPENLSLPSQRPHTSAAPTALCRHSPFAASSAPPAVQFSLPQRPTPTLCSLPQTKSSQLLIS